MNGGRPVPAVAVVEHRTDPFERSKALFSQGQYEAAIIENQKILQDRSGSPDLALFNMGMISAHSTNPKKNLSPRSFDLSYARQRLSSESVS